MSGANTGHNYDPLPLTSHEDHAGDALYNSPPSPLLPPSTGSGFNTPQMNHSDLPGADESALSLPPGAGQPRFMGSAAYENPRDSYASNGTNQSFASDPNNSVRMLADPNDPRSSSYATPDRGSYRDDPSASPRSTSPAAGAAAGGALMSEKRGFYAHQATRSRRKWFIIGGAAIALVVLAVILPVYFTVIKKHNNNNGTSDSSKDSGSSNSKPDSTSSPDGSKSSPSNFVKTGGDGSQVTVENGTTFTYANKFGGMWYWDPTDPLNNNAQAQSWSPPLNQTFKFGTDQIRGVNLGGWLVTEPYSSSSAPALYQKYPKASDEWTLSQAMAADTASGGLQQMEDHYKTFITEQDFAEIAGAGLNWVRIPIGWWAIETRDDEPMLAKTSWTYFLKAIQWARKYGIRINLDLHAVPGSQNNWNHSGRMGSLNFLSGPMGLANAQRTLDYIRVFAEFISQPEYSDVVAMFGILNEPRATLIGKNSIASFYLQAYNVVRGASGIGEGKGPLVSFHDAFEGLQNWAGFLPNADRVGIDTHPYLCFQGQSDAPYSTYATTPCNAWGSQSNNSMSAFGLSIAGEFSNAVTDCGLNVNGAGAGSRYEGTFDGAGRTGSCDSWNDWQSWDAGTKKDIKQFALASMDALQNYFFWTWRIGESLETGKVEAPMWSYKLGLENGWMPTDPRQAVGVCGYSNVWDPPLKAWQTGGAGAGNIAAGVTDQYPWPPATITSAGGQLQTYTATGPLITLPASIFTSTSGTSAPSATGSVSLGSGWANSNDNVGMAVMPAGCPYADPWIGDASFTPCNGDGAKNRKREGNVPPVPRVTTPPSL